MPRSRMVPAGSREAEDKARRHDLVVVKDRCIVEDHRQLFGPDGEPRAEHPQKTGVHLRRRKRTFEDNRVRPESDGYVAGEGGGWTAGGGVRTVVDDKKTIKRPPVSEIWSNGISHSRPVASSSGIR
jgi:hypothetical protein